MQSGFDDGFATTGAPLGRQVGLLRGIANAVLSFLTRNDPSSSSHIQSVPGTSNPAERAREIVKQLDDITLIDIAPIDKEAEEHAKLHAGDEDEEMDEKNEKVGSPSTQATADVEIHEERSLEAAFAAMKTEEVEVKVKREPKPVDLEQIRGNLAELTEEIGFGRVFSSPT